jgi:lectin-like protein
MRIILAAGLIVATNVACLRATEFQCTSDGECGANGRCDMSAGVGHCVAGSQGPDSSMPPNPDGNQDPDMMPAAACPGAQFGGAGHFYEKVPGAATTWQGQRDFCKATAQAPAVAYLAIPDDATELANMATLAGATPFWVGISRIGANFTTTKNMAPVFLPWQGGNPQGGANNDCVEAVSNTQILNVACNTKLPAVCECEP